MRRVPYLIPLLALMLVGLLVVPGLNGRAAQEGTPVAGGGTAMEGVTFEPLAAVPDVALPSPGGLVLVRISLEPGAALPSDPNDPTVGLVLVEAGELTVRLGAQFVVTRAGTSTPAATAEAGGAFAAPGEVVPAGTEVTLRVGDVALFPPNAGGEVRNDGRERAVGLAFLAIPPEAMQGMGAPVAATPGG